MFFPNSCGLERFRTWLRDTNYECSHLSWENENCKSNWAGKQSASLTFSLFVAMFKCFLSNLKISIWTYRRDIGKTSLVLLLAVFCTTHAMHSTLGVYYTFNRRKQLERLKGAGHTWRLCSPYRSRGAGTYPDTPRSLWAEEGPAKWQSGDINSTLIQKH